MCKYYFLLTLLVLIVFPLTNCKKQNNTTISAEKEVYQFDEETYQFDEPFFRHSGNLPPIPPGLYHHRTKDVFAPNGKMIRVYNREIYESRWGPDVPDYDEPILYLYDKDNNVIATYDVLELVYEKFLGGSIIITYNEKRNSFDMVFSIDSYGNYGTAYIDLNTNKFVRELERIERDARHEVLMPEDYERIEGATLGM